MPTRRSFLEGALAAGLSAALPARAAGKPPNVIVVMADEHDGGVMGCMGDPWIWTPNLDRLADEGVMFRSCYAPSPVCGPARLAFTSGKHIHRTGVWSNHSELPSDDYPSIARLLQTAGYDTVLCGKQHYSPDRRYGFQQIGKNYNRFVKDGFVPRRDPDDTSIDTALRDKRFRQFKTQRSSAIMRHDEPITETVTQFLKDRRAEDPPFMLFVGYMAPHFPLVVPRRIWRKYKNRIPQPELPPGHVEAQPLNYHHLRMGFGVVETDPELVRFGRELYYGLVHWLDTEIGALMKALRRSDVADDTIVIYTADHGENKGDHHLWWKNCMYEQAVRIPLIVRWPERWAGGQVREGACSTLDVVQTICELAGVEAPEDWDGRSMLPWLDDAGAGWKDRALSGYYAHNVCSGFTMLRKGPHKYVYHTEIPGRYPAEEELYDLSSDPGEFSNVAAAQPDLCASLRAEMVEAMGEDPEEAERRCLRDYARAARG